MAIKIALPRRRQSTDVNFKRQKEDESKFRLQNQNSRIRILQHRSEHTLAACNRHHHTGPSSVVLVWGSIGYTSRSSVVRIDSTLKSARYISGALRSVALPFICALRNPVFHKDNTQPHVAGIVRTFLDTQNVRLMH
ncbi:transposable element Tcb1 transposase [Trichonephila clavipes]|uniref:Transposable element Tcb1 transposase n=1 Tax=Trichonephila clavipes TaxID=2585209 RepID=A0A8X7B886_TRICX|nr:transposable element Tcb1 transposase [Trichonephila clavipes]